VESEVWRVKLCRKERKALYTIEQGTYLEVVVTIEDVKVAISTYKRRRREVLGKIKAGVIAYEKDYGASRTNGK
jgi:hypothetical protein